MLSSVDIKREADLCSACLSTERSLCPLTADSLLYTTLLNTAQHTYQYSVSLCWECRALLRRVRQFRLKIQRAHQILTRAEPTLHSQFSSLSCLTATHQVYNFDDSPCNQNEKFQIFCGVNEETKPRETYNEDNFKYNLEAENIFVESLPVNETVQDGVKVEVSAASEDLYGSDHTYETHLDLQAALSKGNKRNASGKRVKEASKSRRKSRKLSRSVKKEKRIKTEPALEEYKRKRIIPDTIASFDKQTIETYSSDNDDVISERMPSHTDKKPFQCEVCSKTFTLKQTLIYHIRIHTGEKPFQCELCPRAFPRKQHLRDHAKTHTGEKAYSCEVCHKLFSKRTNMVRHMLLHTGEKCFQCEVCSKQYTRNEQLLNHMRKHHDKSQKPFSNKMRERLFKCEICLKAFAMKGTLKTHMKSHSGEKPFQCEICLKAFTLKGTLNIHMKSHTGEKTFLCDICLKAFTHQGTLLRHIMTHTGEKPFECEVCSKKHSQKAHLLRHLRTHIGQKLFQCSICQKAFTSKQTMIIHFRNHTGEKPFQCERCPNAFTQKRQLLAHRRIHIDEKVLH